MNFQKLFINTNEFPRFVTQKVTMTFAFDMLISTLVVDIDCFLIKRMNVRSVGSNGNSKNGSKTSVEIPVNLILWYHFVFNHNIIFHTKDNITHI